MRKILTKEESEKKRKRNQLIIGVILVGLMILSTVGYAVLNNEENVSQGRVKYNGIEFVKDANGLWESKVNGQNLITYYNPEETENISANLMVTLNDFYAKPLYFVLDNKDAAGEIIRNIGQYVLRSQEVCLDTMVCESRAVIKNCTGNNIIVFKEKDQIKLYKLENCVFIEAPFESQVLASDRLIFKLFNIQN